MNKEKLMKMVEDGELLNTNMGLMQIFNVDEEYVEYGFLIGDGNTLQEPLKDFLKKWKGIT